MKGLGERGFTMLEVLITVTLLGILASLAVPRFANATMLANTAKVQSDLQTLDAAIAIYELERGEEPKELADLSDYVVDIGSLKPPKGKCSLKNGDELALSSASYSIESRAESGSTMRKRAVCESHTAGDFGKKE